MELDEGRRDERIHKQGWHNSGKPYTPIVVRLGLGKGWELSMRVEHDRVINSLLEIPMSGLAACPGLVTSGGWWVG